MYLRLGAAAGQRTPAVLRPAPHRCWDPAPTARPLVLTCKQWVSGAGWLTAAFLKRTDLLRLLDFGSLRCSKDTSILSFAERLLLVLRGPSGPSQ